ncbi:MAG: hypothetical protein IJ158_10835 [Treponema sp.]|nr:hypothetical protein [Treponema sp.]
MSKKLLVVGAFFSLFSWFAFAQKLAAPKLSATESANLKQGADAYKNEDWTSAIFFLRKAVSAPGSTNDETYFMLIKSEIYAGEYRQAQNDCEKFMERFAASPYLEYVQYQNGRLLHLLARNEDAILSLSDFCHQNAESELYPLALFWIAESFYDEYNFESARGLYERVVTDFSACEKAPNAQYKLDLIERRAREEKLLYLLKVIGEENLSTREEYERQLRIYALEDDRGIKKSLIDAEARIAELEALLEGGGYPVESTEIAVAEEAPVQQQVESAPVAQEPAPPTPAVAEKPASSGVSTPENPKQTAVQIIQNVNETSIRVKQNASGQGTSAVKNTGESSKEAEIQALKRKAKQLQYLLEDQDEGDSK